MFSLLASGVASASTVINVAVAANSPPMLFKSTAGKIEGADMDIFSGFCKKPECTMNIKEYTFEGMLGAVASGQADVAFSGISITPKREKVMAFSAPYYDNSWYLVSTADKNIKLKDLSELKDTKYKIGYPRGMAYTDLIKTDLEPQGYYSVKRAELRPSYNEVLTDLKNGNINLAFIEKPVLNDYLKKGYKLVESYEFKGKDTLGFAFTNDAKGKELRDKFNKYLTQLGPKEINKIVDERMK